MMVADVGQLELGLLLSISYRDELIASHFGPINTLDPDLLAITIWSSLVQDNNQKHGILIALLKQADNRFDWPDVMTDGPILRAHFSLISLADRA